MSKKTKDDIVLVVRNTDIRHHSWEPESGQNPHREGSLSDSVKFMPGGTVGLTAEQAARMGKPPRGCVVESFDERKHRHVKRMG